jgi:hypothetical protein
MTVRNGIYSLAKHEDFRRFLQSAHQQTQSGNQRSSAVGFDFASTKESLKSLKTQLVQFIENYMDKAIKDLEKGVAVQTGAKNPAVQLTEKFNSFGDLFSKMENLQKSNTPINEDTVDAARLNRLCIYFADFVETGESDKKLRFLPHHKIQKMVNSNSASLQNNRKAEEFAQAHYEKVLLKVKRLLESTEAVLGDGGEGSDKGEENVRNTEEAAEKPLQSTAEFVLGSPNEDNLGPKINKIHSKKEPSPVFTLGGPGDHGDEHPSIITVNTSIDSKDSSIGNILNTLRPSNILKLEDEKFIEYPKYEKFEKYEIKNENTNSNLLSGKHLMTTPPKENPFRQQQQRHSSKKSKENFGSRDSSYVQQSSQNNNINNSSGSIGSLKDLNQNHSGSVGSKDYSSTSLSYGSQVACTSRLQFRSLQHFCDAIEVNYLTVWSLSFRVLRDNIILHGLNHYPIFIYNNSYTASLGEADLDVSLMEGGNLQGKLLSTQTFRFKRTNNDSNETEYVQRINLKKTIKLRKNCTYTLAITNITEETMENDNKLFFCFGDEVSTKTERFEYFNTDMRNVQNYKVDGDETTTQMKNKRDQSSNQPTDLFIQSLIISEPVRSQSGKGSSQTQGLSIGGGGFGEGSNAEGGPGGSGIGGLFSSNTSF